MTAASKLPANISRFSITIDGITAPLRLTRLEGKAQISGLFYYDICFANKSANFELKSLLERSVLVTVHDPQSSFVRGNINEAEYLNQGSQYTEYRIRIVPRLWQLTQRRNHRLFQDLGTHQIIKTILQEHGYTPELYNDRTAGAKARPYCVQYGETDFSFVSRLMREEGWHFHFVNDPQRQSLILADDNAVFPTKNASPTLRYQQETSRPQDEECVHYLKQVHHVRSGAVRVGDFDYQNPGLQLSLLEKGDIAALEHYHFPGRFQHEQHGSELAQRALQQADSEQLLVSMSTHSPHCDAGQVFDLEKHPNAELNRRYLITEADWLVEQPQSLDEGDGGQGGRCLREIRCIPHDTPFRAPITAPHDFSKPLIHGPQVAIVTGPDQGEIYTDEQGRVKVQFYWDREGRADETTSGWLRVNQPLAGLQWGGIALPRVGQEVLVEFEHGDPDRPVIAGRLYNGQNATPSNLPRNKRRSVLRTLSSPGGGGYNEIRLDDSKGQEQIFIRAERDLDLRVNHNLHQQSGQDRHLEVEGQLARETGGDWHQSIGGDESEHTGKSFSLSVGQDLQLKICGAHVLEAGNSIHIRAGNKVTVDGGLSLSLKAGTGTLSLDATGVSIAGLFVNLNEGGSSGSNAHSAETNQPGNPAEADNDAPGSELRSATPATRPLAPPLAAELSMKKSAQISVLDRASQTHSTMVEECEECGFQ